MEGNGDAVVLVALENTRSCRMKKYRVLNPTTPETLSHGYFLFPFFKTKFWILERYMLSIWYIDWMRDFGFWVFDIAWF